MIKIIVSLPRDRHQYGKIRLVDATGKTIGGPFDALGLADRREAQKHNNGNGNPNQPLVDPTKPYGDTPTGTYRVDGFKAPENSADALKHGPYDRIRLTPIGGDARKAKRNGRTYIEIHGGNLNAANMLRATYGCIRVRNEDLSAILTAIHNAGGPPNRLQAKTEDVSVEIGDAVSGEDNPADPPTPTNVPITHMPTNYRLIPPAPPKAPAPTPEKPKPRNPSEGDPRGIGDNHPHEPHEPPHHEPQPAPHHEPPPRDTGPHDREPRDPDPIPIRRPAAKPPNRSG